MRPVVLTGLILGSLLLAGCVSTTSNPEALKERHRQQCSDFGFEPGTDGFATCMMEQWERAEDREAEDRRRTNDMIRENNRRAAQADAIKAQNKQMSFMRAGNTSFPICNAASPGAGLDVSSGKWYGNACRAY
ncbi:hypothetical protein [Chelatococcus asaccharovorans]|uniref:Lipoprotein n=1 Tax=Chelatococcus asaccharovorans TaxID=28210 RepID=A0A2V3U1Z7_9HYPH|nr:hypothetical protein [Chelatococcus asaccharovorans]MBS7704257.1 hypothetical protein [Chelatococcus asaccharovorans]PXW55868.1 hypothetical protein C7450_109281 [Chelatococcus asaccharovorans]